MLNTWIYSTQSDDYIVKAEWAGGAVERNYSATENTWQQVTLTLGSSANDMTNVIKVLIFPKPGVSTGSTTFWLDDIQLK